MGRNTITTERLLLRPWAETDAECLYRYAADPAVGPAAGWQPHRSADESLEVIRSVLNGAECYAICEKENGNAIGSIELMRVRGNIPQKDDECELGYWLGKPSWGRGYVPEAAAALLRRAFEELGMSAVWCGYYDGNEKSRRVQEKLGFQYHHTCGNVNVPLLGEVRTEHISLLTRTRWQSDIRSQGAVL